MLVPDYYIDIQWLHNISFRLERFKPVSNSNKTFTARCPFCGDSEKSSKKTRLYFYTKKGSLNFDCKNCGAHGSFWRFMNNFASDQFEEYKRDQVLTRLQKSHSKPKKKSSTKTHKEPETVSVESHITDLANVVRLTDLPDSHEAVQYMRSRGFDDDQLSRLLYSDNFKITAQSISPEQLSERFPEEPRIVIPFYDKNGNVEMIQGRSLDKNSKLRYISIKKNEDDDKVYGKERIDPSKTVYCVEGPLDSLFVDNCLATCDSALTKAKADVYIWDNQPRSREIVDLMQDAIDKGYSIVIWPVSPDTKMDINDMILMGLSKEDIMNIIKEYTFMGLRAKLELNRWKRI